MAKAIWKRVVDAGLKSAYSERGNDKLVALIVCAIGMAYVPLESHNVVGNKSQGCLSYYETNSQTITKRKTISVWKIIPEIF